MIKEKPAETAEAFLVAEDKRIYDDLVKIRKLLSETFCGKWISRSHCNALEREAKNAYREAERTAELFWGCYEVWNVREKKREWAEDLIGSFDVWNMYHGYRFNGG